VWIGSGTEPVFSKCDDGPYMGKRVGKKEGDRTMQSAPVVDREKGENVVGDGLEGGEGGGSCSASFPVG